MSQQKSSPQVITREIEGTVQEIIDTVSRTTVTVTADRHMQTFNHGPLKIKFPLSELKAKKFFASL